MSLLLLWYCESSVSARTLCTSCYISRLIIKNNESIGYNIFWINYYKLNLLTTKKIILCLVPKKIENIWWVEWMKIVPPPPGKKSKISLFGHYQFWIFIVDDVSSSSCSFEEETWNIIMHDVEEKVWWREKCQVELQHFITNKQYHSMTWIRNLHTQEKC